MLGLAVQKHKATKLGSQIQTSRRQHEHPHWLDYSSFSSQGFQIIHPREFSARAFPVYILLEVRKVLDIS